MFQFKKRKKCFWFQMQTKMYDNISQSPLLYSLEQENYVKYGDILKYHELHITITLT